MHLFGGSPRFQNEKGTPPIEPGELTKEQQLVHSYKTSPNAKPLGLKSGWLTKVFMI